MPAWPEVSGHGTIRGEEPLGLPGRLEPLPPPFPQARRLVGVSGAVIEMAVLAMVHSQEELSAPKLRSMIADLL